MWRFPPLSLSGTNWHKEMTKDGKKELHINTKITLKVCFSFGLTSEPGDGFV